MLLRQSCRILATGTPIRIGGCKEVVVWREAKKLAFSSSTTGHQEENIGNFQAYKKVSQAEPVHFKKSLDDMSKEISGKGKTEKTSVYEDYTLPHPIWSTETAEAVKASHRPPVTFSDKMAFFSVKFLRTTFDLASGYTIGQKLQTLDERAVLTRCIFLETVAGIPGFAAALIRHLNSLRRMQRDNGWIHTLLEEAENERMHLMTFMQLRRPGFLFRYSVIVTQFIFTAAFSFGYLLSPNFCHRFVGYLEEQAVVTYSHILEEIDGGRLPMWANLAAPEIAVKYWQLSSDAMMRDVILAIRADEDHHRAVNHKLGSMKLKDKNPFKPGQ